MMTLILWLKGIKNALFAGVAAVLTGFALWFRWSSHKFEKQAKAAQQKAEEESYRAAGAEAAVVQQQKGAEAVKKVRARSAKQPKPNTKKRDDLDSQW